MNLPRNARRTDLAAFTRFCSALTLEQGTPLILEPFQRRMLRDYFDGVVETLILLPKKNGKTTLLSALGLFHLCVTADAECVVGAASRDQATILYDQAAGFIRRSEGLQQRLLVRRGYREIRSRRDAGRMRVLAADVDTADGVIPTLALMDELHRQGSAGLYGIFRDGLGPRDGQMLTISVAGEHEGSPLGVMRQAARRLPSTTRKGKYVHAREGESFAMHEWSLTTDDDVHDLRLVKMVNPASWQTLGLLKQRHDSPSMLPWQWARFACGVWMSADEWWLVPDEWHGQASAERLADGDEITLGFDGARTGDATALVACRLSDGLLQPLGVWQPPDDGREWSVPTSAVDACLDDAMQRYAVVRGYFDPPLWQSEIDGWAQEFGDLRVARFNTNRSRMQAAVERFRTDLAAGTLVHTGEPTLTQHALNAQMRQAREGYWLRKNYQGSPDRIDAAVAAVLAYEARADALAAGQARDEPSRALVTF